jgi:hypothetical protein
MSEDNFAPQGGESTKMYKRIGGAFIALSILMLGAVMYVTLARATIIVTPKEQTIGEDLLVNIQEKNLSGNDIFGRIEAVVLTKEAAFPVSGDGASVPAKATGQATIYNTGGSSQKLVATTRLLSASGVLFRLKDAVIVPAGKTVEADIYADLEGKAGEIGPTQFTIPGLSASLQKKIYAKSSEPTTGGEVKAAIVTEEAIKAAADKMTEDMLAEAKEQLRAALKDQSGVIVYKANVKKQETDIKAGEQASQFSLKMEVEFVGAAYDAVALQDEAQKTLVGRIATDRRIISSNVAELKPVIDRYDLDVKSATLKVEITGRAVIKDTSEVFDKGKLTGKTTAEVTDYLQKNAGVESVEIKYFPFWLTRTPRLRDHIKIIVK